MIWLLLVGCVDPVLFVAPCEEGDIERVSASDTTVGISPDDVVSELNDLEFPTRLWPVGDSAGDAFTDTLTLEVERRGRARLVDVLGSGGSTCPAGQTLEMDLRVRVRSDLGFDGEGEGTVRVQSADLASDGWLTFSALADPDDVPAEWAVRATPCPASVDHVRLSSGSGPHSPDSSIGAALIGGVDHLAQNCARGMFVVEPAVVP